MDFASMELFGYIAKYGNLSLASEEMHLSQSSLSRALTSIEKELGVKLYDRTTSPMELTPEGEIALKGTCTLTAAYYQMMLELKTLREHRHKIVRISGLFDSSMASYIYKIRKRIEELELRIMIRPTLVDLQIPFNALRDGIVDILLEAYSDMIDMHDLTSLSLVREQAYLLVETDNKLTKKDQLKVEDLRDTILLSLNRNIDHSLRKHVQCICRNHGFAGKLIVRPSLSRENLLLSDFSGAGMLLPESMLREMKFSQLGGFVAIPIEDEDAYFDLRAFFLSDPNGQPTEFLECLEQVVALN